MSEQHATSYISRVVKILNEEELEPRDKAIILASLAQCHPNRPARTTSWSPSGRLSRVRRLARRQHLILR